MELSIIFPAYNESNRILPVLENYYLFFKDKLKNDFEMIIIPNNCSDNTAEIVKKFSYNKSEVSFFEIKGYSGKGGAVMKGFDLAKGNLIGFVDSDRSTSPKEFFKLYKNIENNEGIIGSRKIKGAKIIPKRSFDKRISSFGFSFVVRILFNFKYKDTQCGAKIFKKEIAKYFSKHLKEKGWIFDVNLLNLAKKEGYQIKEFPIIWEDDDGSHIGTLDGIKSILNVIKYKFTS
ncbi:MAG TPA: glycosyltransferase [Candidatus Pacearchaeota archaeon]|nr:glycosyltransferase [Candidatus Pacearchaeota archaeon]HPX74737.1 glycosyltransferase [Candidatus Pacearchaeota archaeon]HQC61116.1 glycosyltransferase [Candidatus Pacearchaeota archaeon]